MIGEVSSAGNTCSRLSWDQLQALSSQGGGSGNAQYYAIVPSTSGPPTRWTLYLYPTDAVAFTYQFIPDALDATHQDPWGGAAFSDLLEEAVLWAVESREDDDSGSTQHRERFMELLAGLVAMDVENMRLSGVKPFPFANNSTTLELGYYDLIREIGDYMGFGGNFASMTQEEQGIVLSLMNSGLRIFYSPSLPGFPAYQWTFLQPEATLAVDSTHSLYSLPAAFGSIVGDFTWPNTSGAWRKIKVISEARMREMRQDNPEISTLPCYAAIQPVVPAQPSTGTRYQVQFDQMFDNTYSLGYVYRVLPTTVTAASPLPYGGTQHAETIRLACLWAAEQRKTGKQGVQYAAYMQSLKGSIDADSQLRPIRQGSYFDGQHRHGDLTRAHGIGSSPWYYNGTLINS